MNEHRIQLAQEISRDLKAWLAERKDQFRTGRALGFDRLGIPISTWGRISAGSAMLAKKNVEYYARLFVATGLSSADPRKIPAIYNVLLGRTIEVPQAWTEEQFHKWYEKEGYKYRDDIATTPSSNPESVVSSRKESVVSPPAPVPRAIFPKGTTLGGLLDAVIGLAGRPSGRGSDELQPAVASSIVTGVVEVLTPRINAAISDLIPQIVEAIVIRIPTTPAFDMEAVRLVMSEQLAPLLESIEQSRPKSRTVVTRTPRDAGHHASEFLAELRKAFQGTREDRDRFVLQFREPMAEIYQGLAVMLENADIRERNLLFANKEV